MRDSAKTGMTPAILLIHGEDEFAITQYLAKLQADLGDASIQAMNLSRLDGRTFNPDELLSIAAAMPFLSKRRLVIYEYPTVRMTTPEARKRFTSNLDKLPLTTLLVLVEYKTLTDKEMQKRKKQHWLEEWAFAAGERVLIRRFDMPRVEEMPRWIQDKAKSYGGQFTRDAANELATLIGDEPRQADQEIQKLLTYVNYRRPVEREDVHHLTADTREGDIFILVDALGNRNIKAAMGMLERLLEQGEPIGIFSMIVRQYRLLLQMREIIDRGGLPVDAARELHQHPYVAEKVFAQAKRFSLPVLELIYHRLLAVDAAMKTSQMPGELALETLVVDLGNIDPVHANPEMVW